MKKIYFRRIMVEITRRCQLKCEHCMRGDAQDLDISNDIIDSFLEQTAGIGNLFFTGGEPTLAPNRMNYFVDRMIEKGIPLGGVSYITNGVELSEEVKAFLVKAHSYITESREKNEIFRGDCKIYFQPRIFIGLSIDNFHVANEKVKREYEQLLPMDSCFISYVNNDIPVKIGRGKDLEYGFSIEATGSDTDALRTQVGMEYQSHHLICDDSPRSEEMLRYCDAFIPCMLELTAIGKLFSGTGIVGEYVTDDYHNDNVICQFIDGELPSIFDSVIEYNKGCEPCYITTNKKSPISSDDISTLWGYKKVHDIDTSELEWTMKYDRIFSDDINQAEYELNLSLREFVGRHKSYLRQKVEYYSDVEEIKRDFPNSNTHFCKELQNKIMQSSIDDVIDWIISEKDNYWYRVDDALFEPAKFSYNQAVMNKYKKERDKIMQSDMPQPIKAAMNKELLKAAREQLAK